MSIQIHIHPGAKHAQWDRAVQLKWHHLITTKNRRRAKYWARQADRYSKRAWEQDPPYRESQLWTAGQQWRSNLLYSALAHHPDRNHEG